MSTTQIHITHLNTTIVTKIMWILWKGTKPPYLYIFEVWLLCLITFPVGKINSGMANGQKELKKKITLINFWNAVTKNEKKLEINHRETRNIRIIDKNEKSEEDRYSFLQPFELWPVECHHTLWWQKWVASLAILVAQISNTALEVRGLRNANWRDQVPPRSSKDKRAILFSWCPSSKKQVVRGANSLWLHGKSWTSCVGDGITSFPHSYYNWLVKYTFCVPKQPLLTAWKVHWISKQASVSTLSHKWNNLSFAQEKKEVMLPLSLFARYKPLPFI